EAKTFGGCREARREDGRPRRAVAASGGSRSGTLRLAVAGRWSLPATGRVVTCALATPFLSCPIRERLDVRQHAWMASCRTPGPRLAGRWPLCRAGLCGSQTRRSVRDREGRRRAGGRGGSGGVDDPIFGRGEPARRG